MIAGFPFFENGGGVSVNFVADVLTQNAFLIFGGIDDVDENFGEGLRHDLRVLFRPFRAWVFVVVVFPGPCPGLD